MYKIKTQKRQSIYRHFGRIIYFDLYYDNTSLCVYEYMSTNYNSWWTFVIETRKQFIQILTLNAIKSFVWYNERINLLTLISRLRR